MGHVRDKKSDCHLRVAIYARVSCEQQTQAQTIDSQVAALKERVLQDGLAVDPELCFIDDGYSGASLIRPALERLRDMAAMGVFDRLYAHCPDRLARKYAYQVLLLDELKGCGIEVVFLNHPVGQSPEDQLLLQVQGMVAEYERAKIMERCRRGRLHAARQGSVNVLAGAPYGYRYISARESGGQARYEVILEQARVVRQIFQWIGCDRLSIGEVRRRLQKQGIPTARGNALWDRASIWYILKNPTYIGAAGYGKTQMGPRRLRLRPPHGHPEQPRRAYSRYDVPRNQWITIGVPAIVEGALFDTVQEQLEHNRKRDRQRKEGAHYLLQGLVVCQRCGYTYYGMHTNAGKGKRRQYSYSYYRCVGCDAQRFGGQRICYNKPVRIDMLDDAVWQDVCSLLKDPNRISQEYDRRLTRRNKHSDLDSVKTLAQKVKRGISRLIDAYQAGFIDRPEFESRILQAKERLSHLDEQITELSQKQRSLEDLQLVIGQVESFANRVEGSLKQAEFSTKREVIRALVKHIEIGEQDVTVVYRVDNLPFAKAPEKGFLQHCLNRARDSHAVACAAWQNGVSRISLPRGNRASLCGLCVLCVRQRPLRSSIAPILQLAYLPKRQRLRELRDSV